MPTTKPKQPQKPDATPASMAKLMLDLNNNGRFEADEMVSAALAYPADVRRAVLTALHEQHPRTAHSDAKHIITPSELQEVAERATRIGEQMLGGSVFPNGVAKLNLHDATDIANALNASMRTKLRHR